MRRRRRRQRTSWLFPTSCSFLWRGEERLYRVKSTLLSALPPARLPRTASTRLHHTHPSSSTQHPLQEGGMQRRHVCAHLFQAAGELQRRWRRRGGKHLFRFRHPPPPTPHSSSLVSWFSLFPLVVVLLKVDTGWTLAKLCNVKAKQNCVFSFFLFFLLFMFVAFSPEL